MMEPKYCDECKHWIKPLEADEYWGHPCAITITDQDGKVHTDVRCESYLYTIEELKEKQIVISETALWDWVDG